MRVRVLGSAAGGGFPQWNCNCPNCGALRAGTIRAHARAQSSIAVCGQESNAWALVNASPDVLQQLRANVDLQPARAMRDSGVCAVVLMDGQVDHVTGLLMLRESTRPWPVWCTDEVYAELTEELPLLNVLEHYCGVERHRIDLAQRDFRIDAVKEVTWHATSLQSKPPPYSRDRAAPQPGNNIALTIRNSVTGRALFYAPGVGAIDDVLWEEMRGSDVVLIDGTCWTDDELPSLGISVKRARDMGHLPQHGPGGMIEWLDRLPASIRKVLIHINNTNPILDEDSPQRAELAAHGIEVAHDGMEWEL